MDWLLYEENIVMSKVKKIHFTATTMQTKPFLANAPFLYFIYGLEVAD